MRRRDFLTGAAASSLLLPSAAEAMLGSRRVALLGTVRPSWVQSGVIIDEDFFNQRAWPRPFATEMVDTRASTDWVPNANGNLVSFGSGVLPISNAYLQVEPSGSNVLLQTAAFASGWATASAITATTGQTSLDGTNGAVSLVPGASASFPGYSRSITLVNGTTYNYSAFVKPIGPSTYYPVLQPVGGGVYAVFNLASGVVTAVGGTLVGSSVKSYSNGWYRISCAVTASNTGGSFFLGVANSPTSWSATYSGDGSGFYFALPKAAPSETAPSSAIPTTTVTVVRAANAITIQRTGIGRVVLTFDDDSQQTISGIDTGSQYTIPTNINRSLVKRLTGYAS